MFKYPYEDEEKWIKEDISCQSLEDETEIKYCLETKIYKNLYYNC